jgi:hypothetical protein
VAAAIFGDVKGLSLHTPPLMPLTPTVLAYSISAMAHPLRALSLAWEARGADPDERAGLLVELDELMGWLGARAADAPDNFGHLLRLVEAERAWTLGDFRAAVAAFDGALREVAGRHRPWHRALIAERAARFYLDHGLEHAGYEHLARARQQYKGSAR